MQSVRILYAIVNESSAYLLDKNLKEIYDEIIANYNKQDDLFRESLERTLYLEERINSYLKNCDLSDINYKKLLIDYAVVKSW